MVNPFISKLVLLQERLDLEKARLKYLLIPIRDVFLWMDRKCILLEIMFEKLNCQEKEQEELSKYFIMGQQDNFGLMEYYMN